MTAFLTKCLWPHWAALYEKIYFPSVVFLMGNLWLSLKFTGKNLKPNWRKYNWSKLLRNSYCHKLHSNVFMRKSHIIFHNSLLEGVESEFVTSLSSEIWSMQQSMQLCKIMKIKTAIAHQLENKTTIKEMSYSKEHRQTILKELTIILTRKKMLYESFIIMKVLRRPYWMLRGGI